MLLAAIASCVALQGAGAARSDEEPADLYWTAQRLDLSGRGADALKSYSRLLARNPESESAAANLLHAAVREGSFADALLAVNTANKAGAIASDAPFVPFVDAFRRKKWADAAKAVEQIERLDDFAFAVPMLRGWLRIAQGGTANFSRTAPGTEGLTVYYGDDQAVYFDLAEGRLAQAQLRLRNFRGYDEPHGRFLAGYAIGAFARAGDQEFADALARQIGVEQGSYTAPAVTAEIGLAAMFARLGLALDEQRQPQKALYFARLGTWIAPQSEAARLALAELMQRQDYPAQSADLLAAIGPSSPFWTQAVINRTQLAPGKDEAVRIAQEAMKLRPGSSQIKILYAQLLEQAGKRAEAVPVYRTLLASSAASAQQRALYLLMLAAALDAEGDWPEARKSLEEAVSLDPKNAQILNYLGYSLLERRIDIARGFELVSQAHQLAPQSAAITDSLGWAHFLQGRIDEAIPLLERAVRGAIADVAINEHLGDAYWAAGRKTDARYAWRAAALAAESEAAQRLAQKIDFGWTESTAAP